MKLRRSLAWVRTHPWIGTAFLSGALIGVLLCLPIVPYSLPDSTATLLGSAIGAALAVLGAAWVSQSKEDRARQLALAQIRKELSLLNDSFEPLRLKATSTQGDPMSLRELRPLAETFHAACNLVGTRIAKTEGLFQILGAAGFVAFADVTSALREIGVAANQVDEVALNPQIFGSDPAPLFRHRMDRAERLLRSINRIEERL